MPKTLPQLQPCPFQVGDILRWKDAVNWRRLFGDHPGPFIVRSLVDWRGNGPDGRDTPMRLGLLQGGEWHYQKYTWWVGYFERDPFLSAVRARRHKRGKPIKGNT